MLDSNHSDKFKNKLDPTPKGVVKYVVGERCEVCGRGGGGAWTTTIVLGENPYNNAMNLRVCPLIT